MSRVLPAALAPLLAHVARALAGASSPDAVTALEARQFVGAVLDRSPASLAAAAARGDEIDASAVTLVEAALARQALGMPLAYAVGTAAFRHLTLAVDPRVLIPRPETELLVDHVLRLTAGAPGGIAVDIGTGSGAIALALAQEAAFDRVVATDISADALDVARRNAWRLSATLRAPVEFRLGADLAPVHEREVAVLVSNPPYIAYREAAALPRAVRDWEPPTALFAPHEGMARYRRLLEGAPDVMRAGGWVVLECDATRAAETAAIAHATGRYERIDVHDDLAGRPRVLVARVADASCYLPEWRRA